MGAYRKKPVVIEAVQWFKNGDHPLDGDDTFTDSEGFVHRYEGKVVRYYRHPTVPGYTLCSRSLPCGFTMHEHGWIDTLHGGVNVCPGDWIIRGVKGEFYQCRPDIFEATYEAVEP